MQQRFYFTLFQATQLLGGAYYLPEVKKLRKLGAWAIVPFIKSAKLRNYPYKVTITYYVFDDADLITLSIITAYILKLMESHSAIQSADFRVIQSLDIRTQKVLSQDKEGCELTFESLNN